MQGTDEEGDGGGSIRNRGEVKRGRVRRWAGALGVGLAGTGAWDVRACAA